MLFAVASARRRPARPKVGHTIALLHFDGDRTDEVGSSWAATGTPAFTSSPAVFGQSMELGLSSGYAFIRSIVVQEVNFGADDWCMQIRVLPTSYELMNGIKQTPLCITDGLGTNEIRLAITDTGAVEAYVFLNGEYLLDLVSAPGISLSSFTAVEFSRQGSTHRLFVNGHLAGQAEASYATPTAGLFAIVGQPGTTNGGYFSGWLDELRIMRGGVDHTADYTPRTTPFTYP